MFPRLSLKTKVVLVLLSVTLLVLLTEGAVRNRHLLRCMTAAWRSLEEAQPGVYLDASFSEERRDACKSAAAEATARVARFFGERKASPTVVLCADERSLERYAGSARKSILTYRTPFGDYIVAAPPSIDPLLLSHELVHAELDERLGWRTSLWRVPMWFHEGIAMVASGDTRYDEVRLREAVVKAGLSPELSELAGWRAFNRLASQNSDLAYGIAFKEVSLWYRRAGRKGLLRLLSELKNGADFAVAYREIERSTPAEP